MALSLHLKYSEDQDRVRGQTEVGMRLQVEVSIGLLEKGLMPERIPSGMLERALPRGRAL